MLLHLELDNLGKTDIHISLKENQLNNKFYIDNDSARDLVTSSLYELEETLTAKGYKCINSVVMREEHQTPIKDIIEEELQVQPLTRYNFDLRA